MNEELDVSWFDLKKYDALTELDLNGWERQIEIRNFIFYDLHDLQKDSCYDADNYSASELFKKLKKNPISTAHDGSTYDWKIRHKLNKYPFNTDSVYSTPVLDMWMNANEGRLNPEIWDNCSKNDSFEDCDEELIETPYDLLSRQAGIQDDGMFTNVIIDLTATNEQILHDFKYWLLEYRKATGYESNKNNFSKKDFVCWCESRLLPYIDLTFSAAIEGKKITQPKIASLIFPDYQHIDTVDKLRRTTKPKAEWLLKDETLRAIQAQLYSFKGNYSQSNIT